jgi:hypothetical protein
MQFTSCVSPPGFSVFFGFKTGGYHHRQRLCQPFRLTRCERRTNLSVVIGEYLLLVVQLLVVQPGSQLSLSV